MTYVGHPDLPSLKLKKGSVTASQVAAGGSANVTIKLGIAGRKIILSPIVSTSTADASVKVIGWTPEEVDVEVTNSGAAAQDVVVDYEIYHIKG